MLLADLILKTPNHKPLQTLACTLMVVQLALNIVPASGEAFGGMYHASQMASVVKTILTAGTLLVFLQSGEWLSREDTRHKAGEFYMLTLSTLLGMYFMVSAGSFILFYVAWNWPASRWPVWWLSTNTVITVQKQEPNLS